MKGKGKEIIGDSESEIFEFLAMNADDEEEIKENSKVTEKVPLHLSQLYGQKPRSSVGGNSLFTGRASAWSKKASSEPVKRKSMFLEGGIWNKPAKSSMIHKVASPPPPTAKSVHVAASSAEDFDIIDVTDQSPPRKSPSKPTHQASPSRKASPDRQSSHVSPARGSSHISPARASTSIHASSPNRQESALNTNQAPSPSRPRISFGKTGGAPLIDMIGVKTKSPAQKVTASPRREKNPSPLLPSATVKRHSSPISNDLLTSQKRVKSSPAQTIPKSMTQSPSRFKSKSPPRYKSPPRNQSPPKSNIVRAPVLILDEEEDDSDNDIREMGHLKQPDENRVSEEKGKELYANNNDKESDVSSATESLDDTSRDNHQIMAKESDISVTDDELEGNSFGFINLNGRHEYE